MAKSIKQVLNETPNQSKENKYYFELGARWAIYEIEAVIQVGCDDVSFYELLTDTIKTMKQ